MIRVSINLVFIFLVIYGCQKPNLSTFYYQANTKKSVHQYKLVKTEPLDTINHYEVYEYLDANWIPTEKTTKRRIRTLISDSILYSNNLEFLIDRTVGKCHTFNFHLEEEFLLWDYTACLIRNVEDTTINGISVQSCSVYSFAKNGEVVEKVIFDWNNRVLVELVDINTEASVRLVKVE